VAYEILNVTRAMIYENLDTKDVNGKQELLCLPVREKKTLSDAQWASVAVQKHLRKKRIRSKKVS